MQVLPASPQHSLFGFEGVKSLLTNRDVWFNIPLSVRVGVFNGEGPPVPIPNTVVKLIRADNTLRATARKDRSSPTLEPDKSFLPGSKYSSLAQSVEHAAVNRGVVCSSQTGGASGLAATSVAARFLLRDK